MITFTTKRKESARKAFSFLVSFMLLIQSTLPYFVVAGGFALSRTGVQAQEQQVVEAEATPTEAVIESPTPEATPTEEPSGETEQVQVVSVTPEATPTEEPTSTPSPAPSSSEQSSSSQSSSEATQTVTPTPSESDPIVVKLEGEIDTLVVQATQCFENSINGCATVLTDKADYAPTEVVFLTAHDFIPGVEYRVVIYSHNSPAVEYETRVVADENGVFSISYQLDGIYRPNYFVDVFDMSGTLVAETIFADSDTGYSVPTSIHTPNNWVVNTVANVQAADNVHATDNDEKEQGYSNFDFPAIPAGATINGVEIAIEAKNSDSSGCQLQTRLSWDNGSSNTSTVALPLTSIDTVLTFGGNANTWGRTWAPSDFTNANFVVKVMADDVSGNGCANGSILSVDQIRARIHYTEAIPTGTPTPTTSPTPTSAPIGGETVQNSCIADLVSGPINCTANDVSIANVENIEVLDDGCTSPDDTVTFKANWVVQSTATQRYNVGLWFATGGQPSALSGSCSISTLPYGTVPPWYNFDINACGDISSNAPVKPQITLTVACIPDANNYLNLPYCTSWEQNANSCGGPLDTVPGAPSKCNCNNGFSVPITVPKFAKIEVVKDLVPATDTGTFNLQVDGVTKGSCKTDGGSTGEVAVTAGTNAAPGATHTVGETSCAGTDLSKYTKSISCVKRGTSTVVASGTSAGPLDVPVQPNDDILCTITNTVPTGTLTVTKQLSPAQDAGKFNLLVNSDVKATDVGDEGTTGSLTLNAGSYTVSETAGAGTDLNDYNAVYSGDCDAQGSVTVPSGGSATCTITNTRKTGTVIFEKIVDGGNALPSDWTFSIAGVSGLFTHGDQVTLPTGTYSVEESSDADYDPTSVGGICSSLEGQSATLTVTEAGGTCTFTNTVQYGDITVVKAIDWNENGIIGDDSRDTANAGNWTTWDIDGVGNFETGTTQNVMVGSYTISEDQKENYHLVSWSCTNGQSGTENDIDVIVDTDGVTCTIVNAPDRTSIAGMKLNDVDGDLSTTGDQTGVLGWIVNLYSCVIDYNTCSFVASDTTDATGSYSFTNLVSGLYKAVESTVLGWTNLTPLSVNVETTPGEDKTGINFVNFKNGSISGYKWNDLDGDSIWDEGEPALEGWEIVLNDETKVTTDKDGKYEFADLGPGTYTVSETQQSGWIQTYPEDTHEITMTSNGSYTNVNFGNQGRGTVTVYKNLDTDGNGSVDEFDVADWTWDITDGAQNNPMGSVAVPVSAGTYTISEDQKSLFNVTQLVCEDTRLGATESAQVTVSPGENVVCTFTNTRKVGDVTFEKIVAGGSALPSDWTFLIDGVKGEFADGDSVTLPTGTYNVSESGNDDYSLTNTTGICSAHDGLSATLTVTEEGGTCTFTNTRNTGSLTVNKLVDTDADGTYEGGNAIANSLKFVWKMADDASHFMGSTVEDLETGTYSVTEEIADGYHFTGWFYTGGRGSCANPEGESFPIGLEVQTNQNTEITLCNAHDTAIITIDKITDPAGSDTSFSFDLNQNGENIKAFKLSDSDEPVSLTVLAGEGYAVIEEDIKGWDLTSTSCVRSDETQVDPSNFALTRGQQVDCTFTNTQRGTVIVTKFHDADADGSYDLDEETLGGWTMNLGEMSEITSEIDGTAIFNSVLPGEYTLTEEQSQEEWKISSIRCNTKEVYVESNGAEFTVNPGETVECVVGNYEDGRIIVTKYRDDNGNGTRDEGEITLPDWYMNVSQGEELISKPTDKKGEAVFEVLKPGVYDVSENQREGWAQTGLTCRVDTEPTPTPTPTITGEPTPTPIDEQGGLCHWNEGADRWNALSVDIDNPGHIGHELDFPYDGPRDKNGHPDHKLGDQWCADNQEGQNEQVRLLVTETDAIREDKPADGGQNIELTSGQTIRCEVGNQPTDPVIVIEKLNNATTVLRAGDSVVYTLRLTVSEAGGPSKNTVVTDVTPEGFAYQAGSWSAKKNGVPFIVSEPTYASPGDWSLGDLEPGDVVEMFYTARIDDAQDSGIYPDLAWAVGQSVGGTELLASAGTDGNIGEESFVGTDVEIAVNTQDTKTLKVEREEKGEVLGATTLPATGAMTLWVLLAAVLGLGGFASFVWGMRGGSRSGRSSSRKAKTGIVALVMMGAMLMGGSDAHAAGTSVRIETPSDTNRSSFKVNFVTLDIQGRTMTVTCYQKGPGDIGFSQFDSVKALQAGGDSGSCQVDSSVVNSDGTYQFYVEALPLGGATVTSPIVTADVNTKGPKTPTEYSKKKIDSCKYELRFRTGDDAGLTTRIEIYRADERTFNADAGSRIHEQAAGSNELILYTNEVSNCNKEHYYGVRAFSATGAGSDVVGDSIVTFTTSTTSTTTSGGTSSVVGGIEVGAIPVGGAQTGDEAVNTADGEGAKAGEDKEGADAATDGSVEPELEEVLGAQTSWYDSLMARLPQPLRNPWILGGLIVGIIAILVYVIRKKRA